MGEGAGYCLPAPDWLVLSPLFLLAGGRGFWLLDAVGTGAGAGMPVGVRGGSSWCLSEVRLLSALPQGEASEEQSLAGQKDISQGDKSKPGCRAPELPPLHLLPLAPQGCGPHQEFSALPEAQGRTPALRLGTCLSHWRPRGQGWESFRAGGLPPPNLPNLILSKVPLSLARVRIPAPTLPKLSAFIKC
jgi:hypothetical protein